MSDEAILDIESVGVRGDGIARHKGGAVYVPFTAPGDRVRVRLGAKRGEGRAAEMLELLTKGERAAPVCPHFGACGGCALQHLADEAYNRAKEALLAGALRQHGVAADEIAPMLRLPAGTRRRARFAVRRAGAGSVRLGFVTRASHDPIDLRHCAVLHPKLVALAAALRAAGDLLWPANSVGAATATLTDTGIDLLLDLPARPEMGLLEALATFAEAQDLARLAWRADPRAAPVPAAQRRPVRAMLSGVAVELPLDAFLQASAEAEAALVAEVRQAVGAARRIADLYAGLGTFTFALAREAAVHAVEGEKAALAALAAAAARQGLAGRIGSERRDLDRQPLLAEELARFNAVVLDPPRAGAAAQSAALAAALVPRIVMVSCNPASFARDARILCDGGYRLRRVQPIDQFVWSAQIELVASFECAAQPAKRSSSALPRRL